MSATVREDLDGLVILRCTACMAGILVPPDGARGLRLWHYGDGSHRILTLEGAPLDLAPRAELRAHVLGMAVRLQDLADDVADLANRLP